MKKIKNFIVDVDGVLTTGQFLYSIDGKSYKVFGPDDSDALNLVREKLRITMVSGDKRGFGISQKRVVEDMGFPLELVSTYERVSWLRERYDLQETCYMGDGMLDVIVFNAVGYSIAPANASAGTKLAASYTTHSRGGEGAVAEAVIHLMQKFYKPIDLLNISFEKGLGVWK